MTSTQEEHKNLSKLTTMLSLTSILLTLSAVAIGPLVASPTPASIDPRQERFTIQNWRNDFADVNFTSGAGGIFSVDWDNSIAGNFVVGKGYRPGRDM